MKLLTTSVCTVVVSVMAVAVCKEVDKRQAGGSYGAPAPPTAGYGAPVAPTAGYGAPAAPTAGYGAPTAPTAGYGTPAAPTAGYGAPAAPTAGYGASAPSLDASFNAGYGVPSAGVASGGSCRPQTKFILTWTKLVLPVTVYDTRSHLVPTTLYKYLTETEQYAVTVAKLATITSKMRPVFQEETKISYKTLTKVLPRVDVVTSTLLFTDDEHLTVTETDHLTKTVMLQYPVEVTTTHVVRVPKVLTSVATEHQTQFQTSYVTKTYEVVQVQTQNLPQAQYITSTQTQLQYHTVEVTHTQQIYHTVKRCSKPRRSRRRG